MLFFEFLCDCYLFARRLGFNRTAVKPKSLCDNGLIAARLGADRRGFNL